jgi:tetratricopeptide (TPR) repeat protein
MALKRDKVLKDAEKLVQKGKVEQAIREYEKILKKFPEDTTIINRVGDLYGRVGNVDRAIELYEQIAKHFTRDGFTTKAIAILKKINRLDPQRLDIFAQLAELYVDQGLIVEAKREYEILADWYIKHDDLEKAIDSHKKLTELEPSNHVFALRLADLLIQRGDTEEALEVYDRLGKMLLDANKLDEAEQLYRHALEQNPPDGEFLLPLCNSLLDAGKADVVREFLDAGIERSPDSMTLKALMVRTYLVLGEAVTAVETARAVLAADPDNNEIRNLVGSALLSTGEAAEAREMLLPAAENLLEKGDFAGAQGALNDLLRSMPQDQEVLRVAVRAFRPSGDQETLFALKAALAESYYRSGEEEGAKRLYLELLEQEPENKKFRQRLAKLDGVEVADGEVSEVVEVLPDEVEVEVETPAVAAEPEVDETAKPEAFEPAERLAEAAVFAKYGLIEKAVAHLEEVVEVFPDEMEARKELALLYAEQGERDAAQKVARPVVEFHRAKGTLAELSNLINTIPELGEPLDVSDVAEKPAIEDGAEAAEPPGMVEFPDEDSDLVEIVDIEGDLVEPAEEEAEPELVVEEFPIDYESAIGLFEEQPEEEEAAADDADAEEVVAEAPVVKEVADEAPVVEEPVAEEPVETTDVVEAVDEPEPVPAESSEPAAAAEEAPVDELPPPPAVADEEVGDELVDMSDSFTGPSLGDLEQIDFFIEQELYEDAARLLTTLEEEHAEDAELLSRRLKLKEVGVLLEPVETVEEGSEELFADEEQYIDLAKELEAELAAEEAMVEEATGRGKGEALLEEVFREFQKGVAEQLSEEDSDTHFNLGIAYREMGLLPEAIREFQVASRDATFFVESCSMIGVCYKDQGMWPQAAEWFQKALVTPEISQEARVALRYDLAVAYESAGDIDQAVELLEEISSTDPAYRDVATRLSALSEQRQAN